MDSADYFIFQFGWLCRSVYCLHLQLFTVKWLENPDFIIGLDRAPFCTLLDTFCKLVIFHGNSAHVAYTTSIFDHRFIPIILAKSANETFRMDARTGRSNLFVYLPEGEISQRFRKDPASCRFCEKTKKTLNLNFILFKQ
jgi:hypothetical protein